MPYTQWHPLVSKQQITQVTGPSGLRWKTHPSQSQRLSRTAAVGGDARADAEEPLFLQAVKIPRSGI